MSDECPTCRGYRNGPRTRRSENTSSLPTGKSRGSVGQDVSENPGGVRRRRSAANAEPRELRPGGVWIDSTVRCMTVPSVVCPDPGSVFQHQPGSTCIQAGAGMVPWVAGSVNLERMFVSRELVSRRIRVRRAPIVEDAEASPIRRARGWCPVTSPFFGRMNFTAISTTAAVSRIMKEGRSKREHSAAGRHRHS